MTQQQQILMLVIGYEKLVCPQLKNVLSHRRDLLHVPPLIHTEILKWTIMVCELSILRSAELFTNEFHRAGSLVGVRHVVCYIF